MNASIVTFPVILLSLILVSCSPANGSDASSLHQDTDPPSTHGMLIVGSDSVFLSHLPMFHSPHDYQVIMKSNFGEADEIYKQDKLEHPNEIYTLLPERFSLPTLFPDLLGVAERTSFKGVIFRGHFERGGEPITAQVTITVEKVLIAEKLSPDTVKPQISYLLFGDDTQIFVAHIVGSKPSFDQVLEVSILDNGFVLPGELVQIKEGGVPVYLPNVDDTVENKLELGDDVHGKLDLPSFNRRTDDIFFNVTKEIYLEIGELSM